MAQQRAEKLEEVRLDAARPGARLERFHIRDRIHVAQASLHQLSYGRESPYETHGTHGRDFWGRVLHGASGVVNVGVGTKHARPGGGGADRWQGKERKRAMSSRVVT